MSLAEIIRIVHALIEADDTVSGASGHAEWQETLHRRCHAAAGGGGVNARLPRDARLICIMAWRLAKESAARSAGAKARRAIRFCGQCHKAKKDALRREWAR